MKIQNLLAVTLLLFAMGLSSAFAQSTLRVGDSIGIVISGVSVEEKAQIDRQVPIDENGNISLPYLPSPIQAAGRTASQLARAIEGAYKSNEIYLTPNITINAQTQARFVNIMGQVKAPQRIAYTEDLTLLSAISACGGFSPYADEKNVRVIRGENSQVFDVRKMQQDPRNDIKLKPGDQIVVKESIF